MRLRTTNQKVRRGWAVWGMLILSAVAVLAFAACDELMPGQTPTPTPETPPPHPFQGGVVAEFNVGDERFSVWVTNPETIQELFDLRDGRSQANIPNGRIHRGPGQGNHNDPYTWHLDPEDIHMAEMTMELCDGAPHFVEEEVDYFVDTVQRYCAWGAELDGLQDWR